MKKLYLTSALGNYMKINGIKTSCAMDNTNCMVDKLKKICDNNTNILLIASNPYNYAKNNNMKKIMKESFEKSKVSYNSITIVDSRNENNLDIYLKQHQLIILLGGHLPTQNNWFGKLNLKNKIKSYNGYIIGQSAGSMNCANIVYLYPEYKEELDEKAYPRWGKGLELTDILIFPHFDIDKETNSFNVKEGDININDFLEVSKEQQIIGLTNTSILRCSKEGMHVIGTPPQIVKNGLVETDSLVDDKIDNIKVKKLI